MADIELANSISAFLVPTIAIIGVALGILNYRLSLKKRNDELFDRRFGFYKKLEKYWLSTGQVAKMKEENPDVDHEILAYFASESNFLFGSDTSEHILSLNPSGHWGSQLFPNEEFSKPFTKYLEF